MIAEKRAATSQLHVGFIPLESTFNNEPHPAHAMVLSCNPIIPLESANMTRREPTSASRVDRVLCIVVDATRCTAVESRPSYNVRSKMSACNGEKREIKRILNY